MSIVNAIIHVGNQIAAASSGGSAPSGGADSLKKSIESLREALLPDDSFEKESKAQRVKNILDAEMAKGPFKVRAMSTSRKTRGRIQRRRSDIDGSG